jgi:hypothetical protein
MLNILTIVVLAKTVILENLIQIQIMNLPMRMLVTALVWSVLIMNVRLMNGVQQKMEQLTFVHLVLEDYIILLVTLLYY